MRQRLKDPKWNKPSGYTWHHVSMDGTMELVRTPYHKAAIPHKGGFGQHISRLFRLGKIRVGTGGKGTAITATVLVGLGLVAGDDLDVAVGNAADGMNPLFAGPVHAAEMTEEDWIDRGRSPIGPPPDARWFEAKRLYDEEVLPIRDRYRQWEEELRCVFPRLGPIIRLMPPIPDFVPERYGYERPPNPLIVE